MTELLTDAGHSRSDLKQIEIALRKGWVIPEQLYEALPKIMAAIAVKGKPREQIAAAKVLLNMKSQNEAPHVVHRQGTTINVGVNVDNRVDERRNRTLAIAQRFGAGRVLCEPQS